MICNARHTESHVTQLPARWMHALRLHLERWRAERAPAQTSASQEMDDLRRRLLQNVSHELRTPVAALSAHLETLALRDDLSIEERRRCLGIAFVEARRLSDLLNRSLAFEELDLGRGAFFPEPFQLAELAHDVAEKTRLTATHLGVAFRVEHPQSVPLVVGDIRLLERVFDVLLKHAARHAAPRGNVLARLLPQSEVIRVEVRVSKPDSLPRSPRRAAGSALHRPGPPPSLPVALDLAMVRKILRLHGSRIDFVHTASGGATFLFALPLATALCAHT